MQMQVDKCRRKQMNAHGRRATAFCAWVDEPEDVSGHCMFVHKFSGHLIYDNMNVYSMVEGDGRSFESFHI